MRKVVDTEKRTVTFYYDDHRDAKPATDKEPAVEAHPSFDVFDLTKVNESVGLQLALHGASQKIGDSTAAVAADAKELKVDPVELAKQYTRETIAQLYAGTWRVNAGGGPRVNELAQAIARATGMPLEGEDGTIAFVAAMTDEDKKVWRAKTHVKAQLAAIAAEKAVAKANALAEAAKKEAEEKAKAKEASEANAPA